MPQEVEYYIAKGKHYKTADLKAKFKNEFDVKIKEHGLERAYTDDDGKLYSETTLKNKYGDNYLDSIGQVGISASKKKGNPNLVLLLKKKLAQTLFKMGLSPQLDLMKRP